MVLAAGPVGDRRRLREQAQQERWQDGYVVAVDGGLAHCQALGLRPHVVVGDLDSLGPELRGRIEAEGLPLLQAPPAKDKTDLELALELVRPRPPGVLALLGTLGGRLDHTLAAVHAGVPLARQGWRLWYAGPDDELWLLAGPAGLTLAPRPDRYLSLLPLTEEVTGVDARGLRWELAGATVGWSDSLGVSNEFGAGPAEIRLAAGVLAVVLSRRPGGAAEPLRSGPWRRRGSPGR